MDRKEKSGVNLTTSTTGAGSKMVSISEGGGTTGTARKAGTETSANVALGKDAKEVYLEKRKLLPAFAKSIHVWGFVVGTVISGEFVGFNSAYAYGLGSMIVAHVFTSLLMITVSLTLTELATAMPFASGSASYANAAFHGSVACIIGYAYTFDMVFIGAEATNFVGIAFQTIFNTELQYNVLYWIASVLLCSVINLSPKLTLNVLVCLSAISCLLAVIPLCVVSQNFDFSSVFNTTITYSDGTTAVSTAFLPYGIKGVVLSLPYTLYLLICFEAMPCCVEETTEIGRCLPRGMGAANGTLLVLSWVSMVVTAGMPPGVSGLRASVFPFGDVMATVFRLSDHQAVTLISVPSVLASQLAIYYACVRYIYGMSRGGYMPPLLSLTTRNGAPYTAMCLTSIVWIGISFILQYSPNPNTLTIINSAGTIFALTAYIIHPLVFIRLRMRLPSLPRPFKVPFVGIHIAVINFVIAVAFLVAMLCWSSYWQWCMLYITLGYMALLPFYYFYLRRLLEDSPEKLFIRKQLDSLMKESMASKKSSIGNKSTSKASEAAQKASVSPK